MEKKDNTNSFNSTDINGSIKRKQMHIRSSSGVTNSSNNLINNNSCNNNNNSNINFYSSLKVKSNNNFDKTYGLNNNNNNNENLLRSSVKIIDREKRIPSSMNNTGFRNSVDLKQTQSYNNIYSNISSNSLQKKSIVNLNEARNSAKPLYNRLPNINNIDKLKIRKLINSNNSHELFKYYKSNSNVTNNTNIGLKSQILNKKV
jgi:hypothetical protein